MRNKELNSPPKPRQRRPLPLKLAPAVARLDEALAHNPRAETWTAAEKHRAVMARLLGPDFAK